MIIRSLILFLGLSLHLSAAPDRYWKHSEQQGDVGSCHTFSTVALIEAAYKVETGKFINLSERDLFLRHYLTPYKSPQHCINTQLQLSLKKKLPDHYQEKGHISDNFKLAQQHGIASEKELPYSPLFGKGMSISINLLRHSRNLLHKEAQTNNDHATLLKTHTKKLRGVRKALTLPTTAPTRATTRQFLNNYTLVKLVPKTTPEAKRKIIERLKHSPVAADISNLHEISAKGSYVTMHSRHSLVISHYHADTNTFSVRSSTFKGYKKVPADTIARGCYHLYYLKKK